MIFFSVASKAAISSMMRLPLATRIRSEIARTSGRYDDDRFAFGRERTGRRVNLRNHADIHARGRIVEDHDRGSCASDFDDQLLLVAAGIFNDLQTAVQRGGLGPTIPYRLAFPERI